MSDERLALPPHGLLLFVISNLTGTSLGDIFREVPVFIVTMIATLRARIARKTRIALWTLVVLSLACWLYVWISFAAAVQVPPLIPL